MNNEKPEGNREWISQAILLIIGILIGFGIGFIVFNNKNVEEPTENKEDTKEVMDKEGSDISMSKSVEISVDDQAPGNTVTISNVDIPQDGWVVIYNDNNGELGSILGARWIPAGIQDDLEMDILAGTTAGNTYYAVLHSDDGKIVESEFGSHEFDHTVDVPLKQDGKIISASFDTISTGARGI